MRKLLIFVLFVLWSLPSFAQCPVWSRTYGGSNPVCNDLGFSIQQTTDSGYILVGMESSFGTCDSNVFVIKTKPSGDTLWSRTYGGSYADFGWSVDQTTDAGYIVAGFTYSFGVGNADVYVIKIDSNGQTLWSRTYGGTGFEEGRCVRQTMDGGYIVAGYTYSFGAGGSDVYLIKINASGDILWNRTYGGSSNDYGYFVQQTKDGGYVITGWTGSFGIGERDVYLIKTNASGDTLWTRTYGGDSWEHGTSVQQTTDGGYIVVGYARSFGAGGDDVYLIKTDSLGRALWSRTYGGPGFDEGWSVQQTTDGGYIVAGTWYFGLNAYDVFLIKTDSSGDTLWTLTLGKKGGFDNGYCVEKTADGGYIVAGLTNTFGAGGYDFLVTKLDALGNGCMSEFVSPTVMFVPTIVTSPPTVVTSPSTIVTSPPTTVTSPATEVTTVCILQRGDANGDGVINSVDVVYLINYLFINGPAPYPLWIGDANCDRTINSADVVYLINYLFIDGPPPCC
jgi:hypothetical protein